MKEKVLKKHSDLVTKKWMVIEALSEEYAKVAGLTSMSLQALTIIYENSQGCTQKLICEQSHFNKQSVNMIIKSFWEKGYVELVEMKEDRRNKRVKLTPSGEKFAEKIISTLWQIEYAALEKITPEQRDSLIRFLEAYEQCFRNEIGALVSEIKVEKTQMNIV